MDVPPLVPLLTACSNFLFGASLFAIHIIPAIAGGVMVVFAGLITRELGGGRFAQWFTALMVITAPIWLVLNSWFAYDPFDQMLTAIFFYFVLLINKKETPGRWILLGIIAGIQISADDIVRIGDTIEMPGRNTEGTVIAITLNTVKVLNSNKTISTIPSHAIVSESFQNWRGLDIAGGRRIKRTINIDIHSIIFADADLITKLKNNPHITSIAGNFLTTIIPEDRMTNLGVFRKYLEHYLGSLPDINTDSALLVSHLQPTENGLPLQLFAYSRFSDNLKHEALQNKIFEHILAIIPEFNLRVFQRPSGDFFRKGRDE